jgi:DnaK suppressor protein
VPVYVEPEPEPEPEPEIIIIEFEPGFLEGQKLLLEAERDMYLAQAAHLREEADAIARELEPSDLQFDEESGEGGSVPVDREVDLMLSAQALAEVEEIDAALLKLERGIYGACEMCRRKIPEERLEVIPHARLCVQCKSGGILNRR